MTVRLERIGDRFAILLTEQEMAELCLRENDSLDLRVVDGGLEVSQASGLPRHPEAYRRTRPQHEGVYRELAK